jgi:RyR domain-containing protein
MVHLMTGKLVLAVAYTCHEANREYCATLGDYSQPHFDDAPEWQVASAMNGVQFVWEELERGDGHVAASASHENWLKHKTAEGWVYGPVKDAAKKTHPCMQAFADLPAAQQHKDKLFTAIVRGMWNALHMKD